MAQRRKGYHLLLAGVICLLSVHAFCAGNTEPVQADQEKLHLRGADQLIEQKEVRQRRWFILVGLENVWPGLEREELISGIFDPVIGVIAPGYDGTNTFTDLRDKGMMWPPQISVGRLLSRHFALSVHGGYSAGTVRTREYDPTLFFGIPLHTRFNIKRYATYLGLDLDYYPFGGVEQRHYDGWRDRLRGIRPTLGARFTWTWAGYKARIKLGMGIPDTLKIRLEEEWSIPSLTLVAGFDVPINHRHALIFNGGYTFFNEQEKDFAGPVATVGWRFMF